jgi:hypothetical protein
MWPTPLFCRQCSRSGSGSLSRGRRGATFVAPATKVAPACWPGSVAPGTPWQRFSCHLASQGQARRAAPLFPHNLLTPQRCAKHCPAGMGFALASSRHHGGAPRDARGSTCHHTRWGPSAGATCPGRLPGCAIDRTQHQRSRGMTRGTPGAVRRYGAVPGLSRMGSGMPHEAHPGSQEEKE